MAAPVEVEVSIESEDFSLRFRRRFQLSWEPEVVWDLNMHPTPLRLPMVAMVALPPSMILLVAPQEVRAENEHSQIP
jgi:hypothetical protein